MYLCLYACVQCAVHTGPQGDVSAHVLLSCLCVSVSTRGIFKCVCVCVCVGAQHMLTLVCTCMKW